ncbi:ATPase central domain-containing protein [Calothrix sp. NIES-4071]|nr:ATPase central domain-containing protein [Calothrix sp. NIES-4071]BAZ54899.1 ATPase central domain-containing protein [Calothrix sp. NIES-4105]
MHPEPETHYRLKILPCIFTKFTQLSKDVDLKLMAQKFQLAGGEIRNIAVAAAFMAIEDGECISMKHLLQATKREFMKMGRLLHEEDFIYIRERNKDGRSEDN